VALPNDYVSYLQILKAIADAERSLTTVADHGKTEAGVRHHNWI
jgi:hypothetical protein